MTTPRTPRRPRGATLLESLVAMAILTVGILALMQLQVLGMYSNQGARAHTVAAQLARELASGLDSLAFDDARLAPTTNFGPLLKNDGTVLDARVYDDLSPITGVRANASLERDRSDATKAAFVRRWSVQDFGATGSGVPARLVAISVVWTERGVLRPREYVMYVSKPNPGLVLANAAAYR